MAEQLTVEQVYDVLKGVDDPEIGRSLVDLEMIHDVKVSDAGEVSFTVMLTTPACPLRSKIEQDCREAVMALKGVTKVEVKLDAKVRGAVTPDDDPIKAVKQLVLVMSGKGGVGKSTISSSIALALAAEGARVGLLDADVQGPSLPTILGTREPAMASPEGRIIPAQVHGIRFLSMGQFLENDSQAVIWRGPMLSTLLRQFLTDVEWGELDYLIADLPPGTGDAALTLTQTVKVTGAVIVTTPQEVALQDVKKAVDMCRAVDIPVIGVVENMSYFICPSCEARHELFGAGGGQAIAEMTKSPLLGQVPLDPTIRVEGDSGAHSILRDPESPRALSLRAVARELAATIARQEMGRCAGGPLPPSDEPRGCGAH